MGESHTHTHTSVRADNALSEQTLSLMRSKKMPAVALEIMRGDGITLLKDSHHSRNRTILGFTAEQ